MHTMKSFMSRFISVVCLQERDLATARFPVWRADNVRNVCNEIELRAPQKRIIKKQNNDKDTPKACDLNTRIQCALNVYLLGKHCDHVHFNWTDYSVVSYNFFYFCTLSASWANGISSHRQKVQHYTEKSIQRTFQCVRLQHFWYYYFNVDLNRMRRNTKQALLFRKQ